MLDFGGRLNHLRRRKGITQQEMSKIVGRSLNCYRRWESGQNEPSLNHLGILADCFGVSVDFLLGREPTTLNNQDVEEIVNQRVKEAIRRITRAMEKAASCELSGLVK